MILPLLFVLLISLGVLGFLINRSYPASTWRDHIANLRELAATKEESKVRVRSEEVRLEDLAWENAPAYEDTEAYPGLVDSIERAMNNAQARAAERRSQGVQGGVEQMVVRR